MRIQVHIPGLDCLAHEVRRAAKALEDIRDMLKEKCRRGHRGGAGIG